MLLWAYFIFWAGLCHTWDWEWTRRAARRARHRRLLAARVFPIVVSLARLAFIPIWCGALQRMLSEDAHPLTFYAFIGSLLLSLVWLLLATSLAARLSASCYTPRLAASLAAPSQLTGMAWETPGLQPTPGSRWASRTDLAGAGAWQEVCRSHPAP